MRLNPARLAQLVHENSQSWRTRRRRQLNALRRRFESYAPCTYEQAVKDVKAFKEPKSHAT